MSLWVRVSKFVLKNNYGAIYLVYIAAAIVTGVSCAWFMKGFEFVTGHMLDFKSIGPWCLLSTPLLFMTAVELIQRAAPCAAGTGIPQAIFAAGRLSFANYPKLAALVSLKTMFVKIAALYLVVWGGASTGREGPTVHVAACIFVSILLLARRFLKVNIDPRSAVVAGGASGLAAAFNTPLAGVAFAIEELTVEYFASIKDYVIMAIIIASVAAQYELGYFSYFGMLPEPSPVPLRVAVAIGMIGGVLGAAFSESILRLQSSVLSLKPSRKKLIPAYFSLALVVLAWLFGPDVLGPGNQVAQRYLSHAVQDGRWMWGFTGVKLGATVLSYCAGAAGGVFAPSLAIGSSMGAAIASDLGAAASSCAMVGMAAFLSGAIQAPITAFVIIFEMTGHHRMLIPIMMGAVAAFIVARLMGARHFYSTLAEAYRPLLQDGPSAGEGLPGDGK